MPLYHCAQLDNFLATDASFSGRRASSCPDRSGDHPAGDRTLWRTISSPHRPCGSVCCALRRSTASTCRLRKGYYGASAMPTEILAEMRQRMPNVALWNFYGQTGDGAVGPALRPDEQAQHRVAAVTGAQRRDRDPRRPGPAGTARQGRRDRHRSPPHARLPRRPGAHRRAFRGGWFHSGDLGY